MFWSRDKENAIIGTWARFWRLLFFDFFFPGKYCFGKIFPDLLFPFKRVGLHEITYETLDRRRGSDNFQRVLAKDRLQQVESIEPTASNKVRMAFALHMMKVYGDGGGVFFDMLESECWREQVN